MLDERSSVIKPLISYQQFAGLDVRVGIVTEASLPDWSKKVLQLRVNFGDLIGEKTVYSAIAQWYHPDLLVNRKFLFVVNFEPKKIGPAFSEGMMIFLDYPDKPVLLPVDDSALIGVGLC